MIASATNTNPKNNHPQPERSVKPWRRKRSTATRNKNRAAIDSNIRASFLFFMTSSPLMIKNSSRRIEPTTGWMKSWYPLMYNPPFVMIWIPHETSSRLEQWEKQASHVGTQTAARRFENRSTNGVLLKITYPFFRMTAENVFSTVKLGRWSSCERSHTTYALIARF